MRLLKNSILKKSAAACLTLLRSAWGLCLPQGKKKYRKASSFREWIRCLDCRPHWKYLSLNSDQEWWEQQSQTIPQPSFWASAHSRCSRALGTRELCWALLHADTQRVLCLVFGAWKSSLRQHKTWFSPQYCGEQLQPIFIISKAWWKPKHTKKMASIHSTPAATGSANKNSNW